MIPTYWQTGKITTNNPWFPRGYKDGNVGLEQKKSNENKELCQNSKVVGLPSVPIVRHNSGNKRGITMVVEWRDIEGFPRYQVSSEGQVRTKYAAGKYPPMVLKNIVYRNDYIRLTLCDEGRRKRFPMHTLVCTAFHGPRPSRRHVVAHHDGNKLNNHYTNLRWVTVRENYADNVRLGVAARGSRQGGNKLTERDIPEIRALRASGLTYEVIGERYGVSPQCIGFVVRGVWWKHVA